MKKYINKIVLVGIMAMGLFSCNKKEDGPIVKPDPEPTPTPTPEPVEETIFDSIAPGKNKTYPKLEEFNPTLFKKDTFKKVREINLIDGADYITYSFNLNNDHKVIANIIDVDLTKAKIDTNYAKSGIDTAYGQLIDYQNSTNKKIAAIMNADFFATGSGTSVNAYVKDNEIIKSKHNDNGVYDYKDLKSDLPASKPMLIGFSGNEAKISPIVNNKNIEETVKTGFSYQIIYLNENKDTINIKENVYYNSINMNGDNSINIVNSNIGVSLSTNDNIYKIKKEDSNTFIKGKLTNISKQKADGKKSFKDCDKYFYIISKKEMNFKIDDQIGFSITNNKDETFDYYNNVIGGRQSLVANGKIAPTVTLENTNGAQVKDIPRSAVGVVNKNRVLLCTIEALRYNKKLTNVEATDSYGLNLPELAELMRYLGSYDALNFDGGGSTQLITQDMSNNELTLRVRSSDYGTYNLKDCRKVYNTILVTNK